MTTLLDINKKSLESQRKIYKGLRQLLITKPLAEITVTDVSEICDISRSTFYRNFNNVIDILFVFFDYYYERYLRQRTIEENQLRFFVKYWSKHKDLVAILSKQSPNILEEVFEKYSNNELNYQFRLKIDLFSSILSKWSIYNKITPEEMEEHIKETRYTTITMRKYGVDRTEQRWFVQFAYQETLYSMTIMNTSKEEVETIVENLYFP